MLPIRSKIKYKPREYKFEKLTVLALVSLSAECDYTWEQNIDKAVKNYMDKYYNDEMKKDAYKPGFSDANTMSLIIPKFNKQITLVDSSQAYAIDNYGIALLGLEIFSQDWISFKHDDVLMIANSKFLNKFADVGRDVNLGYDIKRDINFYDNILLQIATSKKIGDKSGIKRVLKRYEGDLLDAKELLKYLHENIALNREFKGKFANISQKFFLSSP